MKRYRGLLIVFAVVALAFAAMLRPYGSEPASQPVELCGAGREVKAATGATRTDEEYAALFCDHAAAREGFQALKEQQQGR